MIRRTFLQSLVAGVASLVVPKSRRVVEPQRAKYVVKGSIYPGDPIVITGRVIQRAVGASIVGGVCYPLRAGQHGFGLIRVGQERPGIETLELEVEP